MQFSQEEGAPWFDKVRILGAAIVGYAEVIGAFYTWDQSKVNRSWKHYDWKD